jgi:protein involved in plasmid replication-relaxation
MVTTMPAIFDPWTTRRPTVRPPSPYAHDILAFFVRHRTALASHVQRQFADRLHTDRTTRWNLQRLVASKCLAVVRRSFADPNAYTITANGWRAYHGGNGLPAAARPPKRRPALSSHLTHELLITEFATGLTEGVRRRSDLTVPWEDRFGFIGLPAFRTLVPDYGFLLKHAQGLLACFVEVSSGEESPTRLRQKLEAYAAWAAGSDAQTFLTDLYRQHGAREPRPHFRLLFVVQDRRSGNDTTRLRQLLREAMALPRSLRERLWATTVADLAAERSMDAPVWVRARDVQPHHEAWGTLTPRERIRSFAAAFATLPRHRLFPSSVEGSSHVAPLADHPDRVGLSARG